MEQQRYEKVVNILIKQIFTRKLLPGTKLPTEKQLSREMDVDRTSLRVALKQLESMRVLDIRQGDGIYVKDYLKNAGLDFLRIMFLQQESNVQEWLVDEYIIDEIWEFWVSFFPEILKLAAIRFSPRDIKALMEILDEELACIHDKEKIVTLEVQSQDFVVEKANNIVFLLISNSSRPLRKKMREIFIHCIDDKTLREHIEVKRVLLKGFMTKPMEEALKGLETYKEILSSYRHMVRRLWKGSTLEGKSIDDFIRSEKDRTPGV